MIRDITYIVDVMVLPPECVWVSTVVVAGSTLLVASLPLVVEITGTELFFCITVQCNHAYTLTNYQQFSFIK